MESFAVVPLLIQLSVSSLPGMTKLSLTETVIFSIVHYFALNSLGLVPLLFNPSLTWFLTSGSLYTHYLLSVSILYTHLSSLLLTLSNKPNFTMWEEWYPQDLSPWEWPPFNFIKVQIYSKKLHHYTPHGLFQHFLGLFVWLVFVCFVLVHANHRQLELKRPFLCLK